MPLFSTSSRSHPKKSLFLLIAQSITEKLPAAGSKTTSPSLVTASIKALCKLCGF